MKVCITLGGYFAYHCCSVTKSCLTLCNSMDCSTPGIRIPHYLPEFAQGHVHWIRDGYQTISSSATLFSFGRQSCPASGSFHWVGFHIRWAKYWSFLTGPSNVYSRFISFRIYWFDLVVQGTLKSLLWHRSFKSWILRHLAFFIVHRSYPYRTTGKSIALTICTFVGKVILLLFSTLSRLSKPSFQEANI